MSIISANYWVLLNKLCIENNFCLLMKLILRCTSHYLYSEIYFNEHFLKINIVSETNLERRTKIRAGKKQK